jgi:ABC-type glycerol-3-phosphate transport system permease component
MSGNGATAAGALRARTLTWRSRTLTWPRHAYRAFLYLLIGVGAVVSMFPLIWTVMTAGKDIPEMFSYPPTLLPREPHYLDVLTRLFTSYPFGRWLFNSFFITGLTVVGTVLAASLVAYSFARFKYPGRDLFFVITLATMMLPTFVTLIPSYQIFFWLGWVNTFKPLIVPAFFGGGAFNIFLMRQFLMTIPTELDEAAEIDGANSWTIFWRIIVPLTKPAMATMAILTFVGQWNNFMGPLIYLTSDQNYTAVLGLLVFVNQSVMAQAYSAHRSGEALDNIMMMASFVTALPGMILFFAFQKQFVRGIVMTGLKG